MTKLSSATLKSDFENGFSTPKFNDTEEKHLSLDCKICIMIVVRGEVEITLAGTSNKMIIKSKTILSFSPFENYYIKGNNTTDLASLIFVKPNNIYENFDLSKPEYKTESNEKIRTLPVKPEITKLIQSMDTIFNDNMYCKFLNNFKEKEWLYFLKTFYTKKETTYLLEPIKELSNHFKIKVLTNYEDVKTVSELAERCNMTTKTFTRNFKKTFNDTPKQWMLKQEKKY